VQAFGAGGAYGFQFHPDVTTAMMHCWTARGSLDQPGAQPRHRHFEGRAMYDVAERAWLKHFIEDWLALMPGLPTAQAAE
jgi:GMP synthase (glutamine-hydrolysing)